MKNVVILDNGDMVGLTTEKGTVEFYTHAQIRALVDKYLTPKRVCSSSSTLRLSQHINLVYQYFKTGKWAGHLTKKTSSEVKSALEKHIRQVKPESLPEKATQRLKELGYNDLTKLYE